MTTAHRSNMTQRSAEDLEAGDRVIAWEPKSIRTVASVNRIDDLYVAVHLVPDGNQRTITHMAADEAVYVINFTTEDAR